MCMDIQACIFRHFYNRIHISQHPLCFFGQQNFSKRGIYSFKKELALIGTKSFLKNFPLLRKDAKEMKIAKSVPLKIYPSSFKTT